MFNRAVFASLLTGIAGQAALVITGVIAARVLGVEDRGWFALVTLFPVFLTQVGTLGAPIALTYKIAAEAANPRKTLEWVAGMACAQATAAMLLHLGLLGYAMDDAPVGVQDVATYSILAVPAGFAQAYGLAALQGGRRFAAFNLLRLLPVASYAGGIVLLFLVGGGTFATLLGTWIVVNLVIGVVTVIVAMDTPDRSAYSSSELGRLSDLLRFGAKGWIGSLGPIENLRIDQAVVGLLLSPAALGLYVVGTAFTNLPKFMSQSIGMVAYPDVANANYSSRRRLLWRYVISAALFVGLTVGVLELSVSWLVPFFFGEDFIDAVPIARILLVAGLVLGVRRVLSGAITGAGRPGYAALSEVGTWIVLAMTLPLLLPRWGAQGAALAVVIASAVPLVVLILFASRPGVVGSVHGHPTAESHLGAEIRE
jgi:O-antigen/teichoic acid export membrane protein